MDGVPQTQGVSDASKDIASSYGVSKEDVVAYFIYGIALAAIIAIIPILIISKTKQSKIDSLTTQFQQEVTDQLASLKKEQKDQVLMSQQITALSTALASRTKNSQILEAFGKNTFKKTKWSSMTLDAGAVSLNLSADSFDDMAKTVVAYRNMAAVQSVKLASATKNEESGKVDFALDIKIDASQFVVKAKAPAVTASPAVGSSADALDATGQSGAQSLTPVL